ncbi:MAG: hypothetical protein COA69_13490 [Robiginitomaculum sp.]|nr:MAG: hypothetical protein COA69_13490 [Robiginitomaculum sp.]
MSTHDFTKIAELTANNDHTMARHALATQFDCGKFMRIFRAIEAIRDEEGHLPEEMWSYQRSCTHRLIQYIETRWDKETAQQAIQAI